MSSVLVDTRYISAKAQARQHRRLGPAETPPHVRTQQPVVLDEWQPDARTVSLDALLHDSADDLSRLYGFIPTESVFRLRSLFGVDD